MNWYLHVLKNYANFNGRARRREYWMFFLFNLLAALVVSFVDILFFGTAVLRTIYSLAVLIPGIAVTVRRLHDTDRSGWWVLLALIPLAGIILLVFACLDGTPGDNRFGANPKASAEPQPVIQS